MKHVYIFMLVIAICLSFFPVEAQAMTPTYNISDKYKESEYYTRLLSVELKGDQRENMVKVALSQVGYHEGNSIADLGGGNKTGKENYTEYNYWYPGASYGDKDGPWCAYFVSWCARQAQIPESIIKNFSGGSAKSSGAVIYDKNADGTIGKDNKLPQKGDLILFGGHVGIVVDVPPGQGIIKAVEGNYNDCVHPTEYPLISPKIIGYAVPNYALLCTHSSYDSLGYCIDCKEEYKIRDLTQATGIVRIIENNVPIRERPYSADPIFTKRLNKGEEVKVIGQGYNSFGNLWYKLEFPDSRWPESKKEIWVYSGNVEIVKMEITVSAKEYGTPNTQTSVPSAPTGLSAVSASSDNNSAKISWSAVSGATSYQVQYWSPANSDWLNDGSYSSGTSYVSTGLSAHHSWTFRIRAVNPAGSSGWSQVEYIKSPTSTPTPTPNLTVLSTVDGQWTVTIPANTQVDLFPTPTSITRTTWYSPKSASFELYANRCLTMSDGSTRYQIRANNTHAGGQEQDLYFVFTSSMRVETPKTYTLTYDANGGSGAPPSQTFTAGSAVTLSTVIPTRSGYNFAGWGIRYNSSFADDFYFSGYPYYFNGDTKLFAIWHIPAPKGTATIHYNANGGSDAPNSHSVTVGDNGIARFALSSASPTKSGYIFLGWLLNNNPVNEIASPGQSINYDTRNYQGTASVTLTYYAQWNANTSSPPIESAPTVTFSKMIYGGIDIFYTRVDATSGDWQYTMTYGCETRVESTMPITEYGLVLLDSNKNHILTDNSERRNFLYNGISYAEGDHRLQRVSFIADGVGGSKRNVTYIESTLQEGKTYYWYVYVLSGGQRIESQMQSFVFKSP